ncbi:MAG: signal transduction histidine kinase regulating citrate/malate metabolism [Actinomycetia bacterium]|jgi:two-component system, CitB family, sensor kinase|nr:signal transduction histidine kinase regulating citrate/malate metabolism [Actinomycetes bacterium]
MVMKPTGTHQPIRSWLARRSLANQMLLLQVAVVALAIAGAAALAWLDARRDSVESARQRTLGVAETFAHTPDVLAALRAEDPAARLQPMAEAVRRATGVDFVVVMRPDRVRYSHPNPALIGGHFLGNVAPALDGRPFTETFTGTLGPSVRAVVPVPGDGRPVEGLVAVGITQARISSELSRQIPAILSLVTLLLALAAFASLLVSRRMQRFTHGLNPVELTRLYEHHDAVLHAMREGLLVLDRDRRLLLVNDEGARLLGLGSDAEGRPAAELGVAGGLGEILVSGRDVHDEIHLTTEAVVVVNQTPVVRRRRRFGTVVTLRDHTELQALTGELDSVRGLAELLKSQAHESANRLHSVVTLIELGRPEAAVEFATAELVAAQRLTDQLLGAVEEPVLVALLLGKAAEAADRGVELVVTDDSVVRATPIDPRDLVTVVGNLIDNAVDASLAAPAPRRVTVTVRQDENELVVRLADTGPGLHRDLVEQAFHRGWSTKAASGQQRPHGRGLGLALVRQVVTRYDGSIEVANDGGAVFTVRLTLPATVDGGP